MATNYDYLYYYNLIAELMFLILFRSIIFFIFLKIARHASVCTCAIKIYLNLQTITAGQLTERDF